MKKKYSKIGGIFCVVVATLLLLIMLISKDFGIFYILLTAFCYYAGIINIRGAKKAAEAPAEEPVIYTPELVVKIRNNSSSSDRKYSYSVYGVRYQNEDGKDIQKLLAKLPKEGLDSSVFYDCMTNADIKEEFDEDDRVHIFDGIEYDANLVPCEFEGKPAVKVYFISDELGPVHIGWISKQDAPDVADMIRKHDCSYKLEIEGGKYKHLVYDDETDKYKVVTESGGEYFARVYISYSAEDAAE